ncbi:MAG: hypothetical protein RL095_1244 [Verrucomicrobiota bacterium]|jgi:putative membrane-bound dehydrogenase-like protein
MKKSLLASLTLALALSSPAGNRPMDVPEDFPKFLPAEMFALPEGLEIKLWAKSPMLGNPTNMDIDSKGRVWVTEGRNYRGMNMAPDGDRVVILEDTDGDGAADKSHTFYQGKELNAPLGIAVIGNEIFVSMSPNMIKFTDVDGNGVFDPAVDKKVIFLSGFSGENHDHTLHSVTAGPDGELYFNTGNTRFTVKGTDGREFTNRGEPSCDGHIYSQGTAFRVQEDGSGLQAIGHNFRNSYEQSVTSFGEVFMNDNDDTQSCRTSWMMEHADFGYFTSDGRNHWQSVRRPGQPLPLAHWRQEDPGVSPAGDIYGTGSPTGTAFYENGALPAKFNGTLLSGEAAVNTVFGYQPKAAKAGFALQRYDFLSSNTGKQIGGSDFSGGMKANTATSLKTWFRPSDITVGPDGALYVCDWYDPRVGGHQTCDYRGLGNIYRIAPKGFSGKAPAVDLSSIPGMIEVLKNPSPNVRVLGFKALIAQGDKALAPVKALLQEENPYIRARAVWILSRLGDAGQKEVAALLGDADPQMRIVAFRALRRAGVQVLENAARLAKDADPSCRREAALALRDLPFDAIKGVLVDLAKGFDGADRYYLEAFGKACAKKEDQAYAWLKAALKREEPEQWSDAFAGIAWRLHAAVAVADLQKRALSATLGRSARVQALDALAFVNTREAAQAVLAIAQNGADDIYKQAHFWLKNRKGSYWKGFGIDEGFAALKREVKETKFASGAFKLAEIKLSPQAEKGRDLYMGRGTCFVCHTMGDQGREVAPDLSFVGAKFNAAVLKEAVTDPDSAIVFGYETTVVKTKDGREFQGFLLSDHDPIVIKDLGGVEHSFPAADVVKRETSAKSLMPSAKALNLNDEDLQAIADFLLEVAAKAKK